MQAANYIFNKFLIATESDAEWSEFDFMFLQCFNKKTEDLEVKYQNYKLKFPDVEYIYDENKWKNDALADKDKKWFYFHIEASNQRNYILNIIEKNKEC